MATLKMNMKMKILLIVFVSILPRPSCKRLTTAAFVPRISGHNETLVNNITTLLNSILNKYDRNFRPAMDTSDGPIVVIVDISVRSMGPISEKDMEFSMDCYFRQMWRDSRLKYRGPLKELSLNANFLREIWRPDTYVRNGQRSYLHTLTVPNILLRIAEDGTVRVSQRLTIKTRCPMFLKKFPMDVQACLVELGSMAYGTGDVMYRWSGPPEISQEVELSQYTLKGIIATERIVPSYRDLDENVSTLLVYFKLQRQQGYYMLQIYTPCILTVVMSWVSFWINKEASPARVALGVMTVLTMSTMSLGGRNELPRVSYSTALDIYAVGSFAFVFFALVEYAVINFAHFMHMANAVNKLQAAKTPSKESPIPRHGLVTTFMVEQPTPATAGTDEGISASTGFLEDPHLSSSAFVLKREETASPIRNILNRVSIWFEHHRRSSSCQETTTSLDPANNNNTPRKQNGVLSMFLDDTDEEVNGTKLVSACCPKKKRRKEEEESVAKNPNTEMDWIDDVAKVLFPAAYLIFNWIYWMTFYWLGDEIEQIPAIRDTFLHVVSPFGARVPANATMNVTA